MVLFGLEDKATSHHTQLLDKEYFLLQLIRSTMDQAKKILIDSPFLMVSIEKDLSFILKSCELLNINMNDLFIVDLISQETKYKEEICHIERCL